MRKILIGVCGWSYRSWKGVFYPRGLPTQEELRYISQHFSCIEINSTFYSLKSSEIYSRWYQQTTGDFIFCLKGHRYITHIKQLNDIKKPLLTFFHSGLLELKEKLGPLLWQLPPQLKFHPDKLEKFLSLLPRNFQEALKGTQKNSVSSPLNLDNPKNNFPIRHALEVRHDSYINPLFVEMMKHYQVAIVFSDSGGQWPYLEDITSDFIYLRLHGNPILYESSYQKMMLKLWAKRITSWSEGSAPKNSVTLLDTSLRHDKKKVFVFFNNDRFAHAPFDALKLIKLIQ